MAKKKHRRPDQPAGEEVRTELPLGVKWVRTLDGHEAGVKCIGFDPQGETLASGSRDSTVRIWKQRSGELLQTLEGHGAMVRSVAFDPQGETLASASEDKTVKLWEVRNGKLLRNLEGHQSGVYSVAFDPQGETLASGGRDKTVKLWTRSGSLIRTLEGHSNLVGSVAFDSQGEILASGSHDSTVRLWEARSGKPLFALEGHGKIVRTVAFNPRDGMLASGSYDKTVKLWETRKGKLVRTLEGHTWPVDIVAFSPDGRLLASKSRDQTIRLWNCETWETVGVIPVATHEDHSVPALAFHSNLPLLAAAGSVPGTGEDLGSRRIYLWELDYKVLFGNRTEVVMASGAIHHTTGKIILLGDHSVGKSALGFRLINGRFEKQESTHGQKFWVFPALGKRRADGTECEAILWDFAGQPDYRLVHALFVDNADLALVLFDASDLRDPLHGVGFWLKQLQAGQSRCPILLVAAQSDRGACSLTREELEAFCQRNGIEGPITTSAFTGEGIAELVERMKSMIAWEDKPATVTTTTFKRIKDYILGLKGTGSDSRILVTPEELRGRLQATDATWAFTDAEMLTAVGHLENYGYVKPLRTSKGELRILLQPERLNNLASSFVLEARRNPKGLGALEEKRLLAGNYDFPELTDLTETERGVLLDSAALLFLEHNICLRETDPLRMEPYLVFPELINLKKPADDDQATEEGTAYTVTGPTENVFASLVVLLGYTHTFTRTAQWQNNARYEVGDGLACGFRQEAERDGELDFVHCFDPKVDRPVRMLFQGLFESFLGRRNLTVLRYEPVRCSKGHALNRTVVREALQQREEIAFCPKCGERLKLPETVEPIQLARGAQDQVEVQRLAAEQRTHFEQAVFRVRAYVAEQKITPPECFISYAWGVPAHERWVEKLLATDLQKAGIGVVLDRWENSRIGSSILRFVERIEECGQVIVIGTPLYRQKAKNLASAKGSVVAAEWDLTGIRLLATEDQKGTILPILLAGEESESFPPLLRGRVYGDFRVEDEYFAKAFDLILDVYDIPHRDPAVADLRESLR